MYLQKQQTHRPFIEISKKSKKIFDKDLDVWYNVNIDRIIRVFEAGFRAWN